MPPPPSPRSGGALGGTSPWTGREGGVSAEGPRGPGGAQPPFGALGCPPSPALPPLQTLAFAWSCGL